jgi:hypothetical protein
MRAECRPVVMNLRERLMHKKIAVFKRFVSQFAERDGAAAYDGSGAGAFAINALWRSGPAVAVYSASGSDGRVGQPWLAVVGRVCPACCFAQYLELRCNN